MDADKVEAKAKGWLKRALSCLWSLLSKLKFWAGRLENSGLVRRLNADQIDPAPHSKMWFLGWTVTLAVLFVVCFCSGWEFGKGGETRVTGLHTDTVDIGAATAEQATQWKSAARYWKVEFLTAQGNLDACKADLRHAVEHDGPPPATNTPSAVITTTAPPVPVLGKIKPTIKALLAPKAPEKKAAATVPVPAKAPVKKRAECGTACQAAKSLGIN